MCLCLLLLSFVLCGCVFAVCESQTVSINRILLSYSIATVQCALQLHMRDAGVNICPKKTETVKIFKQSQNHVL